MPRNLPLLLGQFGASRSLFNKQLVLSTKCHQRRMLNSLLDFLGYVPRRICEPPHARYNRLVI